MSRPAATAVIAEDEPLLAMALRDELANLWPELVVVAAASHGEAAVERALALRPDLVFLDIRMPGMSGIEAAQALSEDWEEGAPLPLLVFVTAYDQYALQAFEHAAIDYVLKPIDAGRLAKSCARLQTALVARRERGPSPPAALDATLGQLRDLLAAPGIAPPPGPMLSVIQASVGATIHMVPIGDVLYFEAADKYIRVITAAREYLIRMSLRQLLAQLDARTFWQVHRGTVVRADAIATAVRDDAGKLEIRLRGRAEVLPVSRLYAHRFKAM
jgi:DNA-binding LytR/AlgR family response regulator